MAVITAKVSEYIKMAWIHKKKMLFFGGLIGIGVRFLNKWNNEQILRTAYAKKAEQIGASPIEKSNGPVEYMPPKIHIFVDKSDKQYHKNIFSFKTNALPLLQLAGFDTIMKDVENSEDLRDLSCSTDLRNCAGVVVVGKKEITLPLVLPGLFANSTENIGHSARDLLTIFDPDYHNDVEGQCQKTMKIIYNRFKI